MSLINFSQIKGGKAALKDLQALKGLTLDELTALDAAKTKVTLTRVVRDELTGEVVMDVDGITPKTEEVSLSVTEYLQEVEATLNGAEGSLEDRIGSVEETLARPINDRVRVKGEVDEGGTGATLTTELVAPIVAPEAGQYLVYAEDNTQFYNATGEALTVTINPGTAEAPLATATFTNGVPHQRVVTFIKEDGTPLGENETPETNMIVEEKVEFVPVVDGTAFKAYPVATYTLGTLPQDAFLDEEELALVAYGSALTMISAKLAKDTLVMEEIIAKIKTLAVDEAIKQITDALAERLDALEAIKTVHVEISLADLVATEVEGEQRVEVLDLALVEINPVHEIQDTKAVLSVNGVNYFEDRAFTLDRVAKTITWTAAETLFHIEKDFELFLTVEVSTLASVSV